MSDHLNDLLADVAVMVAMPILVLVIVKFEGIVRRVADASRKAKGSGRGNGHER